MLKFCAQSEQCLVGSKGVIRTRRNAGRDSSVIEVAFVDVTPRRRVDGSGMLQTALP